MESILECNVCMNEMYPWAKKQFYEPTLRGLNEQIQHFVDWITPTEGISFSKLVVFNPTRGNNHEKRRLFESRAGGY